MIQRIQSLFLGLASLLNLAFLWLPSWQYRAGSEVEMLHGLAARLNSGDPGMEMLTTRSFTGQPLHIALVVVSILATLFIGVIIFQFNDRPKQIKWSYIAIIAVMIELLMIVLLSQQGPFIMQNTPNLSVAGFGFFAPIAVIFLVWLAIRQIKKDDELVKSVDRIR